ncbi:MAG TPA: hypothetical protein VGN16_03160 [Acidobacteriaceae bacterium]
MQHEIAFVDRFVTKNKRDRYRKFLLNASLRRKFISELAHFKHFDSRYRVPLLSQKLFVENIMVELQKRHSPNTIFVISEDPRLDRQEMALAEALSRIVGSGMGTVLSCIPGSLVFVETEDERFILERHDPLEKPEYIRFVVGRKDESSNVEQGIFQAAGEATRAQLIRGADLRQLDQLREWFGDNLERPTSFGRTRLPLGICWFKTSSSDHIARIWEMVQILERNGVYVKKIRTDRPGYVVYEDEWQLVAEPFRKGTLSKK